MTDRLRIVFAGTPDFAVPPLEALLASGHDVIAVYTQPDRPAGRGRKLVASPVKQAAELAGIPVYQPATLREDDVVNALAGLNPDLMVVVAYGLLLPRRVLEIPRLGCINIHASLLPRWRGAAPIQRAVLAGDDRTGVAIMRMEAGLDTGPVYLARETEIGPRQTSGELHDRLSALGAEALIAALPGIADGTLQPQVQDGSAATYAHKIEKAEGRIDWQRPAGEIGRQVRAFNPWPVAFTTLDGETLRIWDAEPVAATSGGATPPGKVVGAAKEGIDVATGDGVLRIKTMQLAGKRAMSAADFLNARKLTGVAFDA
jgi:methionyl-tRNA formyltransferase